MSNKAAPDSHAPHPGLANPNPQTISPRRGELDSNWWYRGQGGETSEATLRDGSQAAAAATNRAAVGPPRDTGPSGSAGDRRPRASRGGRRRGDAGPSGAGVGSAFAPQPDSRGRRQSLAVPTASAHASRSLPLTIFAEAIAGTRVRESAGAECPRSSEAEQPSEAATQGASLLRGGRVSAPRAQTRLRTSRAARRCYATGRPSNAPSGRSSGLHAGGCLPHLPETGVPLTSSDLRGVEMGPLSSARDEEAELGLALHPKRRGHVTPRPLQSYGPYQEVATWPGVRRRWGGA